MKVDATRSGNGVAIAPLLPEHVSQAYVGWLNDPELIRYTDVSPGATMDSVRTYVEAAVAAPNVAMWRILVEGSAHIGNIRLSNIRWMHRRAEVALMIGDRDYWGRGLGPEAIDLVSRHAFDELDLHKLIAGILEPNVGSRRAFEKAGFQIEAVLREHAVFEGALCDTLQMTRFAPSPTPKTGRDRQ